MQFPGIEYRFNRKSPMKGDNVKLIENKLASLGYLNNTYATGIFDSTLEIAVKNFQSDNGLMPDGIVGKKTWSKLFSRDAVPDNDNSGNEDTEYIEPKYGANNQASFFSETRKTNMRKNGNDIIVTINNTVTRTIKNVIFRSKSQVLGVGGEPIAETYEFIARDLIEGEEE